MRRCDRRIPLLLACAALTGCAATRGQAPALIPVDELPPVVETAPEPPPLDVAALYADLAADEATYETGIALIASGSEIRGERRIANATLNLRQAVHDCAADSTCDVEMVLDTFERLMTQQSIQLKKQADHVTALEDAARRDVEREPDTERFVDIAVDDTRTAQLLRGVDMREAIRLNGPVRAAIEDWLTWMRPMLLQSWVNYRYLRPQIAPIYEEAGLPEALLFGMMATETGGKVHAYSRAGAAGLLQFIRSTGRRYGLSVVEGFDLRMDPREATRANVAYMNDLFAQLDGDLDLALAAYNGGENRIHALQRELGRVGLWDGRLFYSLPAETREYVPRVLAAAWLFTYPEEYDLEFPEVDEELVAVTLEHDASIGELSVCMGQAGRSEGWFRTLRNLNPRRKPGDRVPAGEALIVPVAAADVYRERCLDGPLVARARELHEAAYPPEPEVTKYRVRSGDTLAKIARGHGCLSTREIASFNGIRPPRYMIRIGQQLKLPRCR